MRTFFIVSIGQLISLVGSGLTSFALGVWAYQSTGSVTQFALLSLFLYLPNVIMAPIAGAIVDRWDRRQAMILSDAAAGVGTVVIWGLISSDMLEVWHIYIIVAIGSFFNSLQWPAYAAATTMLVPKQQLTRANGIVQISKATAKIISPAMAGLLIALVSIEGILTIDFISFLVALVTLLSVRFPNPEIVEKKTAPKIGELVRETVSAWSYIAERQGLRGLLMLFTVIYFTLGVLQVLFWPLILNFSSPEKLGVILSIGGSGWLLGSLAITAWGGPKPRINGLFLFIPLQGALLCLGGLQTSVALAAVGIFGYLFAYPIILSCNQAIWQSKVPPILQGRVFALQQAIERSSSIIAYIAIGPLVDRFFEPLLAVDGALAGSVGQIIGVGPGRGIALLSILIGIANVLAVIAAYQYRPVRLVEKYLPDATDTWEPSAPGIEQESSQHSATSSQEIAAKTEIYTNVSAEESPIGR
ncbi:MAG: MFS transporter [Oscillatoria sp. SIO1A7]|nr:MFS transporter [Oscillatoria sp. SIO1A7]